MAKSINCICRGCGASYTIDEGKSDDGHCSFMCWEEANCKPDHTGLDVLELSVADLKK